MLQLPPGAQRSFSVSPAVQLAHRTICTVRTCGLHPHGKILSVSASSTARAFSSCLRVRSCRGGRCEARLAGIHDLYSSRFISPRGDRIIYTWVAELVFGNCSLALPPHPNVPTHTTSSLLLLLSPCHFGAGACILAGSVFLYLRYAWDDGARFGRVLRDPVSHHPALPANDYRRGSFAHHGNYARWCVGLLSVSSLRPPRLVF